MPLPTTPTRLSAAADMFTGTLQDDWIKAGDGDDTVTSEAGNDRLDGDAGRDSLYGGDGNDTLYGGLDGDILHGGIGDDLLSGGDGDDHLDGGAGNDKLYGGAGQDVLDGSFGDDRIVGGGGLDNMIGREGNDTFVGTLNEIGYGSASIGGADGGDGYDVLHFVAPAATGPVTGTERIGINLQGISGVERFVGSALGDMVDFTAYTANASGPYADPRQTVGIRFDGGGGNEIVQGSAHADGLYGGLGDDFLDGGAGNDTLTGGTGQNTLIGGAGDDTIFGSLVVKPGDPTAPYGHYDIALGGAGYDTMKLTEGGKHDFSLAGEIERIHGSLAADDADLSTYWSGTWSSYGGRGETGPADPNAAFGVTMDMRAGDDIVRGTIYADTVYGGDGDDRLDGNTGNDKLFGNAGDDWLEGGDGHDSLTGGDGNDMLFGGEGNDTLGGSAGLDTLLGGAGVDTAIIQGNRADYQFSAANDAFASTIITNAQGQIVDIVAEIEFMSFADGKFALSDLLT